MKIETKEQKIYKGQITEEIRAGLQMTPEEVIAKRDGNNYVEGYVQIHISDIIDNDFESFLDLLSNALVGSDLLMDINYDLVALADEKNEVIFKVTGDISNILETEDE